MPKVFSKLSKIYPLFFSERRKTAFERLIFLVAIFAFIIHFLFIVLVGKGWIHQEWLGDTSQNPLRSIYTPFTIILLYEIYSLIYYLPKSITFYLGKQYEIIALILIRKIFDELANLSEDSIVLNFDSIKELLLIFVGLLVLLVLIFCFYKLSGNKQIRDDFECETRQQSLFVSIKKVLSVLLLILFVFLFVRSLVQLGEISFAVNNIVSSLRTINNTFFQIFFTALILTEVLLLLFTFSLSDKFSKVIRNSGFIISTILLKLSFSTQGLVKTSIVLVAVAFGVAIMAIYRIFEKKLY